MRAEDVGLAGHRSATIGRLALALGLLACVLTALAPAAANAASNITINPSFPGTVAVGQTGSGEIIVTNANTGSDVSTTICNFNDTGDCAGSAGITLIASCSAPNSSGCTPGGSDPNVFSVSSTATGTASSACAGTTFNVVVSNPTSGALRFTPTSGNVTLLTPGSSCHIAFTFSVLKLPADALAAAGFQTRPRTSADAVSNLNETAFSVGGGTVTVKLAAPTVTATSPASPANDNDPEVSGSAPGGTASVNLYPGSNCSGSPVTGSAAAFNGVGITFPVDDDLATTISATVTDSAGGVSACSGPASTVTYVEDSTAPAVPSITDTDPDSPSNNNSPRIKGSAATGSTIRIYTNASCTSALVASGTAAAFGSPGLLVSTPLASNQTTPLYATATDAAGNESGCSSVVNYAEDSLAPGQPTPTGSNPASPSNDNSPQIVGTAPAGSTVTLYTTPNCTGAAAGQGSAASFGSGGIDVTVPDNVPTTFYAAASDQAGNVSPCSVGLSYVEDSLAPSGAVLGGSSPSSPSTDSNPRITGTAPAGTTVRIYTDAACSGSVAGEGSAAAFASPGIAVSVGDNSTTTFYVRSVDAAGNASGCSASAVTYVEDSTAPQTTIDSGPSGSGASSTPTFTFSSSDPGVTFLCNIDAAEPTPCTSPFTTPALGAGSHTFTVRARDSAGNVSTSVTRSFTVGGAVTPPPPPPAIVPPPPPPPVGPTTRAQPGCVGIKGTLFVGTTTGNIRNGGSKTDIMFGLAGNDSLRGGAGLDCLYGGTGNDLLRGGSGADRLFGETGSDRLEGLSGNDRLSGSRGNDRLNGGTGNDRNTAGSGNDRLIDRRGTDRFSGGSGSDRIDARDSTLADRRKRDRILCGAGIDRVLADPSDIVAKDCEKRFVVRRSLRTTAAR